MTISRAALDGPIAAAAAATIRAPRFWIWLAITTIVGLVLARSPLLGVLGYELALITSLVAALASIDLGAALARRVQASPPPPLTVATSPLRLVAALAGRAVGIAVVVALPPAVIAAVHGLWAITCDWWFGIAVYLALPIATAILFGGLGVAIGLVTGPRRRVLGNAAPYLVVLAIALGGLWRFYAEPPVYSYNPIIGYFPGNLYDEHISLARPLAWARLESLAWIAGVLGVCAAQLDAPRFRVSLRQVRPRQLRGGAWLLAVAALVTAGAVRLASGKLGHGVDAEDLQAALGGRLETEHFIIHYARTPDVERDLALIAADHELRYAQVVARLGVGMTDKIRSYYFASRDQKARLFGARNVEMAKPWRKEIYLDHRGFPHASLRHEIAHVVAGEFGDPIFGVSARDVLGLPVLGNPGLIEGLAVAADWPGGYDRSLTSHQAMRVIQALGHEPSVDDLFSLGFFKLSAQRSYPAAGSFLRFLYERYGPAPLRAVYASGGDFAAAYGRTLRALASDWRGFLRTVAIPPEAVEAHRERYTRGGVFDRPCPHATAERRHEARVRYGAGDRAGAIRLLRAICADQPDEPRNRLELSEVLEAADAPAADRAEARAIWRALASPSGGPSSLRAEALSRLAQDAAAADDWREVTGLVMISLGLALDEGHRRLVLGGWLALQHVGPAGPALRAYFFGDAEVPASQLARDAFEAEPTLGLAAYLVGLRQSEAGDAADAARLLVIAIDLGLPHTLYVRNAARRLAVDAFRAGDTAAVERAIAILGGPEMSEVDRLLGLDWAERLAFTRTGALPPPPPPPPP